MRPNSYEAPAMFDVLQYDFSQIDPGWAAIGAAVLGGLFVVIAAIVQSRARNTMKFLGIALVGGLITLAISIFFYVAIVIPQTPNNQIQDTRMPTATPIIFQGRVRSPMPMGASIRSAPSNDTIILEFLDPLTEVKIYAQVIVRDTALEDTTWYYIEVNFEGTTIFGYMLASNIDLTSSVDNPNATPPLVTLTPTPS